MSVDEYLAGAPEPQRTTLETLRRTLRSLLPAAEEGLSYGVPAFKVSGRPVAGFASFQRHCSYFPHSSSVLEALAGELEGYTWSKGALTFPVDRPLRASLVRRLVNERLKELRPGA